MLLLAVVTVAAQPVGDRVDALEAKVPPRNGDWKTEVLQATAKPQLAALGAVLRDGTWDDLKSLAHPDARSTALRDAGAPRRFGTVTVVQTAAPRGPAHVSLAAALLHLRGPLVARFERRVGFKIVGVHQADAASFQTDVRYEAFASSDNGSGVQQVARWRILWRHHDGRDPTILDIRLERFEEVTRPHRLLTECTASVLDFEDARLSTLATGGETWHGRVDGLGELNLMGHNGIAVGDVDGDGDEDLYVAMGTGLPNLLLVRQPDGALIDRAEDLGVAWLDDTKGVLFADMDNDGDQDLLMAVGNAIVLAKNRGNGAFERIVTMRAPTPAAFYSLAVADYDKDGDLDVYGCRYVKLQYGISIPIPFHDANNGPTNHLMRNDGEDRYTDVTGKIGLNANNTRFSLACVWIDHDTDGDPDLYVANDFGRNNLYKNEGGRFVDVAAIAGVEDQAAGMGASVGDFDLDGKPDLYVTNMFSAAGNRVAYQDRFKRGEDAQKKQIQRYSLGNTLFRNIGGRFEDVSEKAGVRMGRWGWGARFCDIDNDGYDDIIAPNGFLTGHVKDDL